MENFIQLLGIPWGPHDVTMESTLRSSMLWLSPLAPADVGQVTLVQHQNSWDLWMFIPLKMVLRCIKYQFNSY